MFEDKFKMGRPCFDKKHYLAIFYFYSPSSALDFSQKISQHEYN